MPVNKAAENTFGTLGSVCWTAQLIPQIWKSWRTKSTEGLAPLLVLLWSLAAVPLGVYNVVQNLNIPLILQPQLFGVFSLVSWGQCQYYDNGHSLRWVVCVMMAMLSVMGALEAGLVYALWPGYEPGEEGAKRGVQFFSVLDTIMISVALLPQYYEIYKHRAVVGISITFMLVDLLDGAFSDLSLLFKESFDVLAAITYSLVLLLDGIVIIAAIILNPLARRRERRRMRDAESVGDTPPESGSATIVPCPDTPGEFVAQNERK